MKGNRKVDVKQKFKLEGLMMWKKLGAGALALTLMLSVGSVPTFANSLDVKGEQQQMLAARQVVKVGNWEVKYGEDYDFVEGDNLVGNITFKNGKLTFQFQGEGNVSVKMWESDGSVVISRYVVKSR
ncbi:hypothetical protein [Paenibacillus tyrfis]|uniref:hypothetical protein n=1 Tax=Paenibacillus tyrfis TaxID=1501230 RepID=UPI000B592FF6|nr:hypothetical protein [Paenibacillus tyrfis]